MQNPVKDITLKKMSCVNNKALCLISLYYNLNKFILIEDENFEKSVELLKSKWYELFYDFK